MLQNLYPLLFETSLHVKVWGGHELASQLGKKLPTDEPYGESWEIFWKNRIANGNYQGKTLADLISADPQAVLGQQHQNHSPEYPLLVKFIDAQDWLSVQVHPNDHYAALLENEPRGKTECWYIVGAKPGAQIAYGLTEAMGTESFQGAVNQAGRVKEVLQYVDVTPGDFIYVPAGMLHAIGPGVLIYELQQTSDTTYRVYDWDRPGLDGKPRDLHIEKSLRVMNFEGQPSAKVNYDQTGTSNEYTLIEGDYFTLKKVIGRGGGSYHLENKGRAQLLTALTGQITLQGAHEPVIIAKGVSTFIPAALESEMIIFDRDSEVLIAWSNESS